MTNFIDSFSEEIWTQTYKNYKDKTIDDTMRRVANAISSVEKSAKQKKEWEENFYEMLSDFKVVPGGRIISNAGSGWKGTTLINCFVGPRETSDIDSLDNIMKNLKNQGKTLKSEGGWGENFSYIRPRGSFIYGIGVETPGAVKYMEMFDKSSEIITAGSGERSDNLKAKGKIRKGAQMGVLDVWHPDIIEFIRAKQKPGNLTKFNISVNCSDNFMNKLLKVMELKNRFETEKDKLSSLEKDIMKKTIAEVDRWDLIFPDTQHPNYKSEWYGDIKSWHAKGYPVVVYKTVSATWLWDLIMESTYNRAEPGVLFLDRANYFNPLNYAETIMATNPCGEQTLAPGNICCLGSLNLTQFVKKDKKGFDLDKIKKYTKYLVRFLDNVNSYSSAPLPEYIESMKNKRRIGIGVMGWGSALYMLQIRFGSELAATLRDELMQTISHAAYGYSVDLAEEKGSFPLCDKGVHFKSPFIEKLGLPSNTIDRMKKFGIRNSSLMSIQPTGTTSILANIVSGGIEPIFMPEYIRTVIVPNVPEHMADVTPKWFQGEFCETAMFKFTKEGDETILRGVDSDKTVYKIDKNRGLTKEVLCQDYGVRELDRVGKWDKSSDFAVSANSLTADDHVNDLKGFAKWVDSAISKTVNLPYEYSFEDFKKLYLDAYKTGYIKGLTTYRSGTMTSVLSAAEEKYADVNDEEIILDEVKLPDDFPAKMHVIRAEGNKWYLTVVLNEEQTRPFAIFVQTNTFEKEVTTSNAVEKMLELALTKKIPQKYIDEVREKIQNDPNHVKITRAISLLLRHGVLIKNVVSCLDNIEEIFVGSFLFQIKKYLASYIKDGEAVVGESCQECGSTAVVYSEGCKKCTNCGSSKCG